MVKRRTVWAGTNMELPRFKAPKSIEKEVNKDDYEEVSRWGNNENPHCVDVGEFSVRNDCYVQKTSDQLSQGPSRKTWLLLDTEDGARLKIRRKS